MSEGRGDPPLLEYLAAFDREALVLEARVSADDPSTLLVPTEDVLLLTVELPKTTLRKRLAILPFAIEHRLAEPILELHIALGRELTAGTFLAGIVGRRMMDVWLQNAFVLDVTRCRIVPDLFVLPEPPAGSWSVQVDGERALVRTANGCGFALPLPLLAAAWNAEGSPPLKSYGDALPEPFSCNTEEVLHLPHTNFTDALDLRQGDYASDHSRISPAWTRVATIIAAGAMAHAALLVADIAALRSILGERQNEARATLEHMTPGIAYGGDPGADLARLLNAGRGAEASTFLPLLAESSGVLSQSSESFALRGLDYNATDGSMNINVETANLVSLQTLEAALSSAGFDVAGGAATVANGGAQARLTIRRRSSS